VTLPRQPGGAWTLPAIITILLADAKILSGRYGHDP
jgi:hypothetical protein